MYVVEWVLRRYFLLLGCFLGVKVEGDLVFVLECFRFRGKMGLEISDDSFFC